MSIATTCPECKALFRLAETLAGKRVKCVKCQTLFIVPSGESKETQPGTPVEKKKKEPVDAETQTAVATKPPSASLPPSKNEEEEFEKPDEEETDDRDDDLPRKRKKSDEEYEDDDRPRKRKKRDDDEDDDEQPRIKKKKRKKDVGSGTLMVTLLIGGAALLICLLCGGIGGVIWAFSGRGGPDFVGDPLPPMVNGAIPITLKQDGTFSTHTSLNFRDPIKDARHTKTFSVRLEQGKTYQIDMRSDNIDCFLFMFDEQNRVVAQDDDGGDGLDSLIVFTPQQTGTFRIDCTSFEPRERGHFHLSIRRF